jgi:hypothetical protein
MRLALGEVRPSAALGFPMWFSDRFDGCRLDRVGSDYAAMQQFSADRADVLRLQNSRKSTKIQAESMAYMFSRESQKVGADR